MRTRADRQMNRNRVRASRSLMVASLLALVLAVTQSCATRSPSLAQKISHPVQYWTKARFLAASPFGAIPSASSVNSSSSSSVAGSASSRVGALFNHSVKGNHFCTASVVDSPAGNLLITAAHCLDNVVLDSNSEDNLVFVPGYANGNAPFGVWTPSKLIVAPQWEHDRDPDYDVGFVVLDELDGKNIEQVLGANRLVDTPGDAVEIHVTGYPSSRDAPISCVTVATSFSKTQSRFVCRGFTGGTSGSPWVANFNPSTHTGEVIGVIGGHLQGGATDFVSYSVRFGDTVRDLYDQATGSSLGG